MPTLKEIKILHHPYLLTNKVRKMDDSMPKYNFYILKKAFIYFTIIWFFVACDNKKENSSEEMPLLYSAPKTIALNTNGGYIINPVTGDSIKPIINSLGDTVITGVPVPAIGKVIHPNSVEKQKIVTAGIPDIVPTNLNVHKVPENLTVISVNQDSLKTFTPGVDISSFVLKNSAGDTIPTGIPIPTKGKTVLTIPPQAIKAQALAFRDNAINNISYLDVDQGMASSIVYSILEDSQGNLWFGTQGGVSRYNGESFTHFTEKQGLSNNVVQSILEDSQGNLWFSTEGGGASRYDGTSFTHFTENEGLSGNNVFLILEDSQGILWFGTNRGASRYDGESL